MTLPAVSAEVAAAVLGRLAGRIRKRSEALLGEQASWVIGEEAVVIGSATVTLAPTDGVLGSADALSCDCLLAPNCAHLAAVVAACPVAEAEAEQPAESAESASGTETKAPPADAPTLTDRQVEALEATWRLAADILSAGAARRDTRTYAAALSALHSLRAAGLIRAERTFTGVVAALNRAVTDPQTLQPAAFAARLADALLVTHVLLRDHREHRPVDVEYLGFARRRYAPVGAITASPLAVEPVLTDSGYAGVVLTLRDGQGRLWTIQDVRPGSISQVRQSYGAGIEIGDLTTTIADLARRRLIMGQATASADGRLGRGKTVRAAIGSEVTYPEVWDDVPRWPAHAAGWAVVTGTIAGGDDAGLIIAGPAGEVSVAVPDVTRALGWSRTARLLARARDTEVVCLVRQRGVGAELVGLHRAGLDPDYGHDVHNVTWCGLDYLDERDTGAGAPIPAALPPTSDEIESFGATAPGVAVLVSRWLARAAAGGLGALRAAARELPADKHTLTSLGAPFAAELLTELEAATRAGGRAFDGTWIPDPEPLARAWLALSRYLG